MKRASPSSPADRGAVSKKPRAAGHANRALPVGPHLGGANGDIGYAHQHQHAAGRTGAAPAAYGNEYGAAAGYDYTAYDYSNYYDGSGAAASYDIAAYASYYGGGAAAGAMNGQGAGYDHMYLHGDQSGGYGADNTHGGNSYYGAAGGADGNVHHRSGGASSGAANGNGAGSGMGGGAGGYGHHHQGASAGGYGGYHNAGSGHGGVSGDFNSHHAGGGGGSGSAAGGGGGHHGHGNRTVWVGNLPAGVTVDQLLDQVHFGALESVRIVPEKSCAFLSFLDMSDASAFFNHYQSNRLYLHNTDLVVRWGKGANGGAGAGPLPGNIQQAVANGASRNVYISGVHQGTTEPEIRYDLEGFGEIDNVRIVPPREGHKASICFVHFCSIASAMKCVASLAQVNPKYAGRRVSYGKDRCLPRQGHQQHGGGQGQHQQHYQHHQQQNNQYGGMQGYDGANYGGGGGRQNMMGQHQGYQNQQHHHQQQGGYGGVNYMGGDGHGAAAHGSGGGGAGAGMYDAGGVGADPTLLQTGNLRYLPPEYHARVNPDAVRTLYLGSLPEDCIPEDICNCLRAGMVEKIHILLPEKACAFVTFLDARSASLVHYLAETHGIVIRGRRVKCGWGKPTKPVHSQIAYAVSLGASRNVYIGPLPDWLFTSPGQGGALPMVGEQPDIQQLQQSEGKPGDQVSNSQPQSQEQAAQQSDQQEQQLSQQKQPIPQAVPQHERAQQQHAASVALLSDFAMFGEVEVIHVLAEKHCAFVNFMDVRSAMRAVDEATAALRGKYGGVRVAYGKDRVASEVRLPREQGMPIGGMIPRRMTGSFAPGAGALGSGSGAAKLCAARNGNGVGAAGAGGAAGMRPLDLPTRPVSGDAGSSAIVSATAAASVGAPAALVAGQDDVSMRNIGTPPVLLELTPEPEDITL